MRTEFAHSIHTFNVVSTKSGSAAHVRQVGKAKTLCNAKAVATQSHHDSHTLEQVVTCKRCRNAINL